MGDPYGKDVFKYGSDDWQARRQMEEWKAERHPPVSNSDWSSSSPSQYNPGTYSSGGRGSSLGLGKLLLFGVIGLALMGYFSSESDKGSSSRQDDFRAQREAYQARSTETTTPAPAPQSYSTSSAPNGATVPRQDVTAASPGKLDGNDERVAAVIADVQAVSQQTLFVAPTGEFLVFEGQLDTPARNLYQTRFDVGALDLYRATYAVGTNQLNVPCKQDAVCVSYNTYEGSTEQTAGAAQQQGTYTSVNVWSPSNEAANRILQDFQQLQSLQH
jgi:hypothetical protein